MTDQIVLAEDPLVVNAGESRLEPNSPESRVGVLRAEFSTKWRAVVAALIDGHSIPSELSLDLMPGVEPDSVLMINRNHVHLTPAELKTMRALARGALSTKSRAHDAGRSPHTAEDHLTDIYSKLYISTRIGVLMMWLEKSTQNAQNEIVEAVRRRYPAIRGRKHEIVTLSFLGLDRDGIAQVLDISVNTVSEYFKLIYRIFEAHSREEVVVKSIYIYMLDRIQQYEEAMKAVPPNLHQAAPILTELSAIAQRFGIEVPGRRSPGGG
jgi:DNA-binding CsgD family transcriptional regulator